MTVILITLVGLSVPMFALQPTVATLGMLALQLVHSLPRTRRLRGWWTLIAQVALCPWAEQKGFLAASVLLIVPGRVRWVLFGAVTLAASLLPHDGGDTFHAGVGAAVNTLIIGLIVFGLTRLSDLRSELHAARGELAAQSVTEERERLSRDLDTVLGSTLSAVIGLADRGRPAEILTLSRDAATRVRRAPTAPPNETPQADMTPRLALPILVAGMAIFVGGGLFQAWARHLSPPAVLGCTIVLAVVGLQVYHSFPRSPGTRPRHVAWTLPLQTVLAFVPLLDTELILVNNLVSLTAASILITLSGRTAWVLFTAVNLGFLLIVLTKPGPVSDVVNATIGSVTVAIMLYGLALLTHLVYQVREARLALAAIAVAKERRRIAADVHDLLGYGLSAITVKSELAARDPARADTELRDVTRIARRTLADLRAIPYDDPEISLHVESASAREVLTAAGIDVRLDINTGLLPDPIDALLATVLREAVTNILRHGRARSATIRVVSTDAYVSLRVTNDGALLDTAGAYGDTRPRRHGGRGIANLTARVAATGGDLTTGPTRDGGYELVVSHPVGISDDPRPSPSRDPGSTTPASGTHDIRDGPAAMGYR